MKRITEAELREKTDNQGRPVTFEEGSLRYVDEEAIAASPELAQYKGKQVVDRECDATGELYTLATSDLHQTHFTPSERPNQRKIKAAARRAAKKAELEQLKAKVAQTEEAAQG